MFPCAGVGTIAPELQRAAQHACCAYVSTAQMSSKGWNCARDVTPVTSSKVRTIVGAQWAIVIAESHGIAPSVARAQSDECAQTKGGRVDPRYEEWSYKAGVSGRRQRSWRTTPLGEATDLLYRGIQLN